MADMPGNSRYEFEVEAHREQLIPLLKVILEGAATALVRANISS